MKKILFVLNDSTVDPLGVMYLMGNIEADFDVLFVKGFDEKVLNKVNIKFFDILAFSTITGSHKLHNRIGG